MLVWAVEEEEAKEEEEHGGRGYPFSYEFV
jgi:hypothetical protein